VRGWEVAESAKWRCIGGMSLQGCRAFVWGQVGVCWACACFFALCRSGADVVMM